MGVTIFITVYVLIVMGIGIYCSKYIKTMDDFALAGRSLSTTVLVGTLVASIIGGATIVGWSGGFYAFGIDWWWGEVGTICGLLLAAIFMAERSRRLEQYTIPDLLRMRYDGKTATIGSAMIIIGDIALTCVQIMAIGGILSSFLGLSTQMSIVIGTIIFIAIAYFGGMVGVAITDTIQAALIILCLIIGSAAIVNSAGGWGTLVSKLPPNFFTLSAHRKLSDGFALALSTTGTVAVWQSIIFSRIFAAKSPEVAKRSMFIMIPVQFICKFCVFILGMSAMAIFGPGREQSKIFATIVLEASNTTVGMLLIAVVIGALITTTNTILLSISVNITRDFYQRFILKDIDNISSEKLVKVGRLTVLGIGILAMLMALIMPSIVSAITFTYTMYSAALLIPVYGGFLWKRATTTGGFLGIIFGGAVALIWHFAGKPFGLDPMLPAAFASAIAFLLGSYTTAPPSKEQLRVFDLMEGKSTVK